MVEKTWGSKSSRPMGSGLIKQVLLVTASLINSPSLVLIVQGDSR